MIGAAWCLALSACPTRTIYYDASADTPGVGGGVAGRAGTAADGAAGSSGPHGLGSRCARGTDCASGFCVVGICCDSACDDICEQCSAAGTCQMAGDDPRCGTISCPQDAPCIDFATSITLDRCASRGACKTEQDCPFAARPAGTYCGGTSAAPQFCDGTGSCDRQTSVACGTDSNCPTAPGACCYDVSSGSQTSRCVEDATTCKPSNPMNPCLLVAAECDSPRDCPPGNVCCYACGLGFSNATALCAPSAACDQNSDATSATSHRWICESNADCERGYSCNQGEYLPAGYKVCEPST
jgi:hypothetical protein